MHWPRAGVAVERARRPRFYRGSRRADRQGDPGKNPDQLRLPGFLWTRALVCELIERRFGVQITEKTAGRYLRSLGFSPQKPVRRAYEQSDVEGQGVAGRDLSRDRQACR